MIVWWRYWPARAKEASQLPQKDQDLRLERVEVEPGSTNHLHLPPFSVAVPSGQKLEAPESSNAAAQPPESYFSGTPRQEVAPHLGVVQNSWMVASTPLTYSGDRPPVPAPVPGKLSRVLSPFERAGHRITVLPLPLESLAMETSPAGTASAEHSLLKGRPSGDFCSSRSIESLSRGEIVASRRPTDDGDAAGSGGQLRHLNSGSSVRSVSAFPLQLDCGVPMVDFEELQFLRSIGRGSYGEVFLVNHYNSSLEPTVLLLGWSSLRFSEFVPSLTRVSVAFIMLYFR